MRKDLEAGEPSQAIRTLCAYEQQAHELYESWDISDAYAESGDPDDLAQLMEDELLPAWDEDEDTGTENDGFLFSSARFLLGHAPFHLFAVLGRRCIFPHRRPVRLTLFRPARPLPPPIFCGLWDN